jgi:hypothetical protein
MSCPCPCPFIHYYPCHKHCRQTFMILATCTADKLPLALRKKKDVNLGSQVPFVNIFLSERWGSSGYASWSFYPWFLVHTLHGASERQTKRLFEWKLGGYVYEFYFTCTRGAGAAPTRGGSRGGCSHLKVLLMWLGEEEGRTPRME